MRYTTTLVIPRNIPCELVPPGESWRYVDMRVRADNSLIVVWQSDQPAPVCACGQPGCPAAPR